MKKAIIIHGTCDKEEYYSQNYPSLSNSHWLPWLQKQLLIAGIEAHTLEIPKAYNPVYKDWKAALERYNVDKDDILIGHSCGAGFSLRWLTENTVDISKLILVAPWLDPERRKTKTFFDFTIDPTIQDRVEKIYILASDDDTEDIQISVKQIEQSLPQAKTHHFKNKGHFTYGHMGSTRFPELLEIILT